VKPQAMKSTQSILSETITQFKFPGDMGESYPIKEGVFNVKDWSTGDEPVFIKTHNDNFKTKITPKEIVIENYDTEFDNLSI
jgi:hypothetical protein